jgi:polyhydroxyalkanoate synthesis regulator phasin
MVKKGILGKEEAREKVNSMIRHGFGFGHDEYPEFMDLLENI